MTAMTTRQSGSEGAALPAGLRASRSALALVCAAQFVLQLDFSIVNVALPTIQRELGFAPAELLLGLTAMGLGLLVFSFVTAGGSYLVNVLPGVLLSALGLSVALPAASVGATTGVDRSEQGLAGGLLTTGQQIVAAVGLALLATLAATRTVQTGSLASGYGFSYLVALGLVLHSIVLVATQLNHQACQAELVRQRQEAVQTRADAPLPQELKKQ